MMDGTYNLDQKKLIGDAMENGEHSSISGLLRIFYRYRVNEKTAYFTLRATICA